MGPLATERLPAVPHVVFGIFNLAIPNLIAWAALVVVFAASAWLRLPSVVEHSSEPDAGRAP
jgi:hypothetical protein